MSTVQRLRNAGHSTFVHGLLIEGPYDPDQIDMNKRWFHIDNPNAPADPADYEDDDYPHAGLRAYRILKPLLDLPPRLHNLHIILRDNEELNIYSGLGQKNAVWLVAGVIAKLKELVILSTDFKSPRPFWAYTPSVSTKTPKPRSAGVSGHHNNQPGGPATFEVSHQIVHFPWKNPDEDITWLWDPPCGEEVALVERFERHLKKYNDFEKHGKEIESQLWHQHQISIGYRSYNNPSLPPAALSLMHQGRDNHDRQMELAVRMDRIQGLGDEKGLGDRVRVQIRARDPNWAEKVEAIAKMTGQLRVDPFPLHILDH